MGQRRSPFGFSSSLAVAVSIYSAGPTVLGKANAGHAAGSISPQTLLPPLAGQSAVDGYAAAPQAAAVNKG